MVPWSGPNSQQLIQRLMDDMITVSGREIALAMKLIVERCKLLVEPAGAAAGAGLLSGKIDRIAGKEVVATLSGGNVDLARLPKVLALAG
jgi:threonine dehydratase